MLGVYKRTHPVYNILSNVVYNILSNVASYKWNFWKRQPLSNITLNLSFCAVVVVLSSVCHEQGVRHEFYVANFVNVKWKLSASLHLVEPASPREPERQQGSNLILR